MRTPELVYCAGGNPRMLQIALEAGFRPGVRLPATVYAPPYFADQEFRNPNRPAYMAALAEWRPQIATVLDWMREEDYAEVLDWAEEAAQYVERVVLIPKVVGGVARLPRLIGGREVVLGYPASPGFAGTEELAFSFAGWPIHLLGGQPHVQQGLWRTFLAAGCEVVSCDSAYANKMATAHCLVWSPRPVVGARNRRWQPLPARLRGEKNAGYLEAFRQSCRNIVAAWQELAGEVAA